MLKFELVQTNKDSNKLYVKYKQVFSRSELFKFFKLFLIENGFSLHGKVKKEKKELPWKKIDFFQLSPFNKLSANAIQQLKGKIKELDIIKIDSLSPSLVEKRKINYRHSEPWSENELLLLSTAIKYTNNLNFLSERFGRSENSIEFYGQKIIYNNKKWNA